MKILSAILIISTTIFLLCSSPHISAACLIMISFTSILFFNFYEKTSWSLYLIFLVFLGGILIIFAYIVSLSESQKSNIPFIFFYPMFLMIPILFFKELLKNNKFIFNSYLNFPESLNHSKDQAGFVLFSSPEMLFFYLSLFLFLLLTLLFLMFILKTFFSALRSMSKKS